MLKLEDRVRLQHMLDHACEAVGLLRERSRADLDSDRLRQLALTRLIEVVGEAATRVSGETQVRLPQIPWGQVVSMRNRLIHGYASVDLDILYQTVVQDLPVLVAELQPLLRPSPPPASGIGPVGD